MPENAFQEPINTPEAQEQTAEASPVAERLLTPDESVSEFNVEQIALVASAIGQESATLTDVSPSPDIHARGNNAADTLEENVGDALGELEDYLEIGDPAKDQGSLGGEVIRPASFTPTPPAEYEPVDKVAPSVAEGYLAGLKKVGSALQEGARAVNGDHAETEATPEAVRITPEPFTPTPEVIPEAVQHEVIAPEPFTPPAGPFAAPSIEPEAPPEAIAEEETFTGLKGQRAYETLGKLGAKAEHFFQGDLLRTEQKYVGGARKFYARKLIQLHKWRADKVNGKLKGYEQEIAAIQAAQNGEDENAILTKFGVENTPNLPPEKAQKRIEALQFKSDEAKRKLETRNNALIEGKKRIEEIASEFQENVFDHMAPVREKLAGLEEQKEQVDTTLGTIGENISLLRGEAERLEDVLRDGLLPLKDKQANEGRIAEIKNCISEQKKRLKKEAKQSRMIARQQSRANDTQRKWDNRVNKENRTANRDVGVIEGVEQQMVPLEHIEEATQSASKVPEEERTEYGVEIARASIENGELSLEQPLTPETFVKQWNLEVGGKLRIPENLFLQLPSITSGIEMTEEQLGAALDLMVDIQTKNKQLRPGVTKSMIRKRLRTFIRTYDLAR